METTARHSFTERMLGAAKLQVWTYEEVEADTDATGQAAGVVALVAIATAIGMVGGGGRGIIGGLISAFVGWAIWAALTYGVGTLLGGTATWGELLRTLGFAQAPGVLYVFGAIPVIGWLVRVVVAIWILIAAIIAIRQALDFGTGRAVLTAVIAWIVIMILGAIVGLFGAVV
jgi:hypothetical protein